MSLEAARNLSVQDLFRVLKEKLSLELAQMRDSPTSRPAPDASLESEVGIYQLVLALTDAATVSNSSGPFRSKVSKPMHTAF